MINRFIIFFFLSDIVTSVNQSWKIYEQRKKNERQIYASAT